MSAKVSEKGREAIHRVLVKTRLPEFEVLHAGWQSTVVARIARRMQEETPRLVKENLVEKFAQNHRELIEAMAIIELAKLEELWALGPKRLGGME